MKIAFKALALATGAVLSGMAVADVTIGVSIPLTGPASNLGISMKNEIALWPDKIGAEKLKVIVLDDATDPTSGVKNTRRLVSEDKVDVIVGSAATPVGIAMADVAMESKTVQLAATPIGLPPGKDAWTFRMPQSNDVMAYAMVAHMKKMGVKTVGFLGYTDAYGEQWLKAFTSEGEKQGIKIIASERFSRTDTSVTAQALKLSAANPDAMLVVASGSGAAMPEMAILDRGYKGKIYQTHAAATKDLMRVGGKAMEGTYVVSGPVIAPAQLPDSNPSKKLAVEFMQKYDAAYGAGTHNQFAGHAHDVMLVLEKAVPLALKKAKPGTPEFRAALKDALETMGRTVVAHGVLNWTREDHWGYVNETGVVVKVVGGDWKIE